MPFTPPGADYQFITAVNPVVSNYSLAQGSVPAVVNNDILVCSSITSPSGYPITLLADGTVDIDSNFDTSRQSFVYYIWRAASDTQYGPATVWINELPPVWDTWVNIFFAVVGVPLTPIDLQGSPYASSPSGDLLAFTLSSGALPDGLTLGSNGTIFGIPIKSGTFNFTIAATDITGTSTISSLNQISVQ